MKALRKFLTFILFLLIVFSFTSCNIAFFSTQEYRQNNPLAEVVFKVTVPAGSNIQDGLFLEILDEVTGLGLNPTRYQLQSEDEINYSIRMPISIGFVVKYRFVRGGNPPSIEYTTEKTQVRYRLLKVSGPVVVHDLIAGWQDSPYQGPLGTLQGFIFNETNNSPVSNVMVIISGMRTFTGADGAYTIGGVPVGEHNLAAYHIDGSFQPFQQGAVIAAGATTPANFGMRPSKLVNITFKVTPPPDHLPGAPIRLIGNLYSLGNTFTDLRGGVNTLASHAPVMNYQEDGNYSVTLTLPAGHPLDYKYTLGDGFWNAEHSSDGGWKMRQIIIPTSDTVINDSISTWINGNGRVITFNIKVPESTPQNDSVSVQFNPFVWMEPIPMWFLGNNQWTYALYSPIEFIHNTGYRFILNEQQGSIDDIATQGETAVGMKIDLAQNNINYSVQQWAFPR